MGDPTSNVARLLIDATEKFAGYVRGAALALQRADVAIALASGVKAQVIVPDSAGSGEKLTSRTGVNVARLVIGEVSREKMPSLRLAASMTGICGATSFR